jgi:hypothetical protein
VALVFASEWPLGGSLACDGVGHWLSAFSGQQFSPFVVSFVDFAHDEQLISS